MAEVHVKQLILYQGFPATANSQFFGSTFLRGNNFYIFFNNNMCIIFTAFSVYLPLQAYLEFFFQEFTMVSEGNGS